MPRVAKWFVFGVGLITTGALTLGGVIGLFVFSSQFFAASAAEPSGEAAQTYALYAPRDATAPSSELFNEVVSAQPQSADPFAPAALAVPPIASPSSEAIAPGEIAPIIEGDDPFGNSPFGPPPGDAPLLQFSDDPFGGTPDPFGAIPAPFEESAPIDAMTLRQKRTRLASLAGEAAALLDAPELDRRIDELERILAEKRADADLAKIQIVLEEITTTFPETPAAQKARRMLNAAVTGAEDCEIEEFPSQDDAEVPSSVIESEPEPLVAPVPAGA